MTAYEKLEWIHCQLQEIQDGYVDGVDIETAISFVEDIRELHMPQRLQETRNDPPK